MEDEIKSIREQQQARRNQIQGYREVQQRIREGNTYDTRAFRASAWNTESGGTSIQQAFATRKEAEDWAEKQRLQGLQGSHIEEGQISPAEAVARANRRMGLAPAAGAAPARTVGQGVLAPGAAPGALYEAPTVGRGVLAPRASSPEVFYTPGAGGAAPAATATPAPPTPQHAEAANAPTVDAVVEAREGAEAHEQRQRRETRQRHQESQALLKELTGRKLGDQLAISALPMAIAEADTKMRMLEAIYKSGAGENLSDTFVQSMMGGTASVADIRAHAGEGQYAARALRYLNTTEGVKDFIYRDNGGRGMVTPINREDQVIGMKPGGPIANATGRGTGGNVNISINGGDERRVFEVVRRAIQQAGITPNRVPSGAT